MGFCFQPVVWLFEWELLTLLFESSTNELVISDHAPLVLLFVWSRYSSI